MKGRPPSLSVPGYTISIPHGNLSPFPLTRLIFQPRLPFIKNRFQKALLPRDSTLYKSNGRNTPLHYSPLLTEYPLPSQTPSLSADCELRIGQGCRQTISNWSGNRHTNIKLSTHLQPHLFCSRCHCRCLWAGSKCRSLGLECCCYSRDYTGWAWKKD